MLMQDLKGALHKSANVNELKQWSKEEWAKILHKDVRVVKETITLT